MKRAFFTIMLFGFIAVAHAAVPRTAVLQPEDLTALVQLGDLPWTPSALSSDGKYVAYVTADPSTASKGTTFDPRGPGRKALWVTDVRSGATQRIGDPSIDAWAPVWSPDGKQLAFYSGVGKIAALSLWNPVTSVTRRMNVVVPMDWAPYPVIWLSDNQRLVVPTSSGAAPSSADSSSSSPLPTPSPAITVFLSTPPPTRAVTGPVHVLTAGLAARAVPFNLAVLQTQTGATHVIGKPQYPNTLRLSPSGKYLAYLIDKGEINNDVNSREVFDVIVADLTTFTQRTVATNILTNFSGITLTWSPDERYLAYVGGVQPGDQDPTVKDYGSGFPGHLYVIDLKNGSAPRRIGTQLLARYRGTLEWSRDNSYIAAVSDSGKELWQLSLATGAAHRVIDLGEGTFEIPNSEQIFEKAGGQTYAFVRASNGEQLVYLVDPLRWKLTLLSCSSQQMSQVQFSADGRLAVYNRQDIMRPSDIWVTADRFATAKQLTHLNPILETRALGNVKDITWSVHGQPYHGILILPAHYQAGKRYAMITWIYGGEPEGTQSRSTFGGSFGGTYMNLQLFASRDYAVFIPDTVLHIGTPMTDLAKEVLPGIDRAITMGVADPKRLGIYGQSYGGYSTLSLIAQSTRFKAAVAMSGIDDLFAMFSTMYNDGSDWTSFTESEQGRMGGTPWQYRQRYINNSPFFLLDHVRTPVLLEYGADDKFAAINLEQTFVSLRSLGKIAELVRYANEGHVLEKPSNQVDLSNKILAWFEKYLR